ncbi:hypothetical protein cyc_00887 [Cyclospora cayetanensis]|uniref:DEAD/DEAH box helicase domain-containing protein n=1 Tax=Cyclospora cayetanensis TaxID=88456 RepID=A0A1D3CVB4_9EIME|nr:hypothetical protein cyc_00887 [Cyclospora cayetanensis]
MSSSDASRASGRRSEAGNASRRRRSSRSLESRNREDGRSDGNPREGRGSYRSSEDAYCKAADSSRYSSREAEEARAERRLPSRADRRGEGDHRTCRQSPSRLSSSKSKDRSGEKEEMRCQTSSSAVRDTDDGAGDSARGSRLPKRVLEEPAEDRELAAASSKASQAKEDTDLLDAFMSALESEAKEEVAKAEDEGQVEALECISSRAAEPPRLQSISLEEISRWQEVEANYLPPAAVAKAAGANAAVPPASTTEAATPPAAEGVKGEGEQQESLVAIESEETQAAAAACLSPDSPRVKQELEADAAAPSASVGAARQTASAGKTAAAQSAATDEGEGGVKAEGEASEASTATALSLAGGEGPNDEDEKYHELFLETLRKEQNTAGEDNDTQAKEQLANLSYFDLVKRVGLKKELPLVDHASCKFPPIKKNLYVQVKELTDLKDHEVEALRKTNGNIKVRGKQCPRPVSAFHQCGLPEKVLRHLEMRGFEKPFPVQSQCMPILMCGRDLIAVAETGSGKTLAYTLPLVRHVLSVKRQYKDYLAKQKEEKLQQQQQELVDAAADGDANRVTSTPDSAAAAAESKGKPRGRQNAQDGDDQDRDRFRKNEKGERMLIYGNFKEGMIGLVIAPTRELSLQISKEVSRLCKLVDLNVASLYGGAGIGGQLGQIRRGVDVVVGTPGRLIDVLTLNSCKFTSLKRVTFVVLDEADRMFDYGFEPQISSILRSTRLDRQTCLFSATFPSHIESLARRILYKPIEVVVGEKGRTAAKVQQYVEVMDEERKFYRLLQLLGDWQDYGSIIIFVNKQIEADELFAELLKGGVLMPSKLCV